MWICIEPQGKGFKEPHIGFHLLDSIYDFIYNLDIQATRQWIQAAFEQQKPFPSRNQCPSPFHVRYQTVEKILFPTTTPVRMPMLPFQPLTTQASNHTNYPMQI